MSWLGRVRRRSQTSQESRATRRHFHSGERVSRSRVVVAAVMLLLAATLLGSNSGLFNSLFPGNGSKPTLANPAGGADRVAAVLSNAQTGATQPAPIHGNSWTSTVSSPPPEGYTSFSHWTTDSAGLVTQQFFAVPMFRKNNGHWQPVDSTVRPDTEPGFPLASSGSVRPLHFGSTSAAIYRLDLDGGSVTLSSPDLALGVPALQGNSVSYAAVTRSTSLSYSVTPAGLQEKLLLLSADAPTSFRFHLSDPKHVLGGAHDDGAGGVVFDGLIDGDVRVGIPRQFAYEARLDDAGAAPLVDPTSAVMSVLPAGDGFDIRVALQPAWLSTHQFPIVLDPQLTFSSAGGNVLAGLDGHVDSSQCSAGADACTINPNSDAGVGADNDGSAQPWWEPLRDYFRFDLSSIPEGSQINQAYFNLFLVGPLGNSGDTDDLNAQGCCQPGFALEMHELTQPLFQNLSYAQLVAATAPTSFTTIGIGQFSHTKTCECYGQYLRVSDAEISKWVNNPLANYGMSLQMDAQAEANSRFGGAVWTNVGQYGQQYAHPANLQVTFTRASYGPVNWGFANSSKNPPDYPQNGNQPFLGPSVGQDTRTQVYVGNQGYDTWPTGGNYRVSYHILDAAGNALADGVQTQFLAPVPPGNAVWVNASIPRFSNYSLGEGSYILRWDMVKNDGSTNTWLDTLGGGHADFRILVAAPPGPSSPSNGTTTTTLTPTLAAGTCGTSGSATRCGSYQFQLTTDSSFGSYVVSSPWIATSTSNPTPSWAVPGGTLQPNTKYYWRTIGRDSYSSSTSWSSAFSFTTGNLPAAPGSVSAQPQQFGIQCQLSPCTSPVAVSWTPPPDTGGSDITAYDVTPYLNWVRQPSVQVSANSTTTTFSGLIQDGSYTFTVAAENTMGLGAISDFSPAVTVTGVPEAPGEVHVIGSNRALDVYWTPADDPADVTGYQVSAYLAGGAVGGGGSTIATVTVAGSDTSAVITQGIVDGLNYTVGVASINSSGSTVGIPPLASPITMSNDSAATSSTPPSLSMSFDSSQYARGASALLTAKVTPTSGSQESGDKLTVTLPSSFDGTGASITLSGGTQTCSTSGVSCTATASSVTVTGMTVPTTGVIITATLRALGTDSACASASVLGAAVNSVGAGGTATASAAICDAGLGAQPWWSLVDTMLGPHGDAGVNVANGNVMISQLDSTPFQLHGHLVLSSSRAYNSQETVQPSAQGAEPVGRGWTMSWVHAGDALGGTSLRIPSDEHVTQAQAVTMIDDQGARVVFSARDLPTLIDVTGLGSSTGPLAPLVPTTLTLASGYTDLCVNNAYAAEPGVHASMWRYVEYKTSGCTGLTASNAKVLGYATLTTDRVRREYAADGRLLSVRDAAGNEVDYRYTSGRLTSVGETGGSGRQFTLTYTTWASGTEVDVYDPAARLTKYQEDGGNHLVNVINPDGSALHYGYGGCNGASADQICSAQDPDGSTVSFVYASAPLGPPRISQITDRLGTLTKFTYAADHTTVDRGSERRRFNTPDATGRFAELKEGDTGNIWLRTTEYTWDSAGTTCRKPDAAVDNNLCSVGRLALNGGATPDRLTAFTYNDEGAIIVQDENAAPSPQDIVTTLSYRAQYVEAGGSVNTFNDSIAGANKVNSATASGGRRDASTVFVISDQTGSLTPDGNAVSSGFAAYQTTFTRDSTSTVGAGIPIGATNPCTTSGSSTTNSGSLCRIKGPSKDGGTHPTVTTYTYDARGQRITMQTPDEYAGTPTGSRVTYTYFQDSDSDLSGTTQAGGWLRGITDATGSFVAFGYDAAGNVVRTWDRNATSASALTLSGFPGSKSSPPSSTYAETLHGTGSAAYTAPWRFLMSQRDPIGNTITYQRDPNGNALGVRSARGNQTGVATPTCKSTQTPGNYDTCSTYDTNDDLLTVRLPVEAKNGSPATVNTYDAYGNRRSTTDPDLNVTTYAYDMVDRQTLHSWTRGPSSGTGAMPTPPGCHASSSADPNMPSNRIVCSVRTSYDGVDNVTSVSNAAAANDGTGRTVYSVYSYDAVHRVIHSSLPRYDGVTRQVDSGTVYDADGNVLISCPPREYSEGAGKCQSGPTSYFSTYNTYDVADQLGASTQYLGYRHPSNNVCPLTSACPEQTQFGYDSDGNQLSVSDANAHVTTKSYDVLDRLTGVTVPRDSNSSGYTTTYGYDDSGNRTLVSYPLPAGGVKRNVLFSFDADNRPLDVVDAATYGGSAATSFPVNPTDSSGGTNIHTSRAYDADGNVVATFSPRAFDNAQVSANPEFMSRIDYDADGRPVTRYVPRYDTADANETSLDATVWTGQASQTTDCPTGATPQAVSGVPSFPSTTGVCITVVEYDAAGRITKLLMPTAVSNSARYQRFWYTDDGLLYQKKSPDPSGNNNPQVLTTYTYDANGKPITSTDPLSLVTTAAWSLDGHEYSIQNPSAPIGLTHKQSTGFDANGNVVSVTDALGAATVTSYTTNNLRESVATPSGGASLSGAPDYSPYATSYTYDGPGNLLSVTSPNANAGDVDNSQRATTTYRYTFDNLLASTTTPPGGDGHTRETDNGYDAEGQRISQSTYEVGAPACSTCTLTYKYYRDGRVSEEDPRDSSAAPKTFTYDADGNTTTWTEGGEGATTYYIDGLVRSNDDSPSQPNNPPRNGFTEESSYDGAGHLASLRSKRDSNGMAQATQGAHYTNAGQLDNLRTNVFNVGSGETRSYDQDGRRTGATQMNGDVATYSYNTDSTLASLRLTQSGNQLDAWSYVYDADYRVAAAAESAPNLNAALSYSYYPDGRLAQYGLSNQGSLSVIAYDHDGNRTSWTPPLSTSGTVTTAYNPDDTLKQTANANGNSPVGYDPLGRMTSDGCNGSTYDGFDRMISNYVISGRSTSFCGPTPTDSTSTSYAYDALDRQGQHSDGTGWWWMHFANTGSEAAVLSVPATGTGEHDRVLTIDDSGTPSWVTDVWQQDPSTEVVGTQQGLTSDGRGNLGDVTNEDGSNTCDLLYDVYGTALFGQSATNSCVATGSQLTELGYRYSQRDATSGDYTFGTRTYDPGKAAFATPDAFNPGSTGLDVAIGSDPLTADRYAYVNGDPVNRIDPTGHLFTTGIDSMDAQGSCGAACNPLDPDAFHAALQQQKNRDQNNANFRADAKAGVQREIDTEEATLTIQLLQEGAQAYQADVQLGKAIDAADKAAAAAKARTCDGFWCGVTQALWGTLSVVGSIASPSAMQIINQTFDTRDNPWLAGGCSGWCWGGQAVGFVATAIGTGGAGIALKGAKAVEVAAGAAEGGADITGILSEHVAAGSERFAAQGFTEGQARALVNNPGLKAGFRGERIDTFAKESASLDSRLSGIQITGRFQRGADFIDPATGNWWDITTPGSWASHVLKYGPGGTMLPY